VANPKDNPIPPSVQPQPHGASGQAETMNPRKIGEATRPPANPPKSSKRGL
jgi:hypothetical protein